MFEIETQPQTVTGLTTLPYWRLKPRARQVRKKFDPKKLEELAASIKEARESGFGGSSGILQPLVVTWEPGAFKANGELKSGARALITIGESRYRALQIAGIGDDDEIPVNINDVAARLSRLAALHENIHRTDLDPFFIATELQEIKNAEKLTLAQLAGRSSKSRDWVQQHLDLLELRPEVAELLDENDEAFPLLRKISNVDDPELRALLVAMRRQGVGVPTITPLLPIKRAPDPLRRVLTAWLEAQWKGFAARGEAMTASKILPALRSESRLHGYVLVEGKELGANKRASEWVSIRQEAPPVLNQAGEITGVSQSTTPAPSAAPQTNGKAAPQIITAPRQNTEQALSSLRFQLGALLDATLPASVIPDSRVVSEHIEAIAADLQKLRDKVDSLRVK